MNTCKRWNKNWLFSRQPLGDEAQLPDPAAADWMPVNLPHDWLISNSRDHYESSEGWYQKELFLPSEPFGEYLLFFEGVYMDCTVYVNNRAAGQWKYGYSSFEIRLTPYLHEGINTILVRVRYASPNSRWYSGAGIYRSVWLKNVPLLHIASCGTAVETQQKDGHWYLTVHTTLEQEGRKFPAPTAADTSAHTPVLHHRLETPDGTVIADQIQENIPTAVSGITPWSLSSPRLYRVISSLTDHGQIVQQEAVTIGFRTIRMDPDKGFFLNDAPVKLKGVCQHHDLGALGAAVNRSALRRQLMLLKEMGVNAIRTSHNMPAVELLELADELGFLVDDEAFDMWERSKTPFDYARFFPEWSARDVESWICRDRNHPSVILWSIGNEIYDTHADAHGQDITRFLMEQVLLHDPWGHALPTIGSNYMPWENAQRCADIVKIAGYNYAERLYQEHHLAHPDWIIYGSETSSIVQSRGIYHFPLSQPILTDDDGQCSSLGNSMVSWGAKSQHYCALAERDTPFSMGQFLWSGFDYIGEPTPYHSRNSFFGQIDTAGFPKDAFYFYQSVWTDFHTHPMVHILPYWDFNPGQRIDIRVYSNAPEVALFVNGRPMGRQTLTHSNGDHLIADWQVPYEEGTVTAVAYDENGTAVARDEQHSFGDAVSLRLQADRLSVPANGSELIFVTIDALDAHGVAVANANNRIHVQVTGEGILAGLDNGDSTDYEPYKGDCRCLFSGKLLAIIAPTLTPGPVTVSAVSQGLSPASLTLQTTPCALSEDDCLMTVTRDLLADAVRAKTDIPVRKLTLTCEGSSELTPLQPSVTVSVQTHPANASAQELIWKITNAEGVVIPYAVCRVLDETHVQVTALSDGLFFLRCGVRNGRPDIQLYSQLEFTAAGMGIMNLDPYRFVTGSLYASCEGEVSNGNEHGAATAPDKVTSITYGPLDFGSFGSDTVTIPIFETDSRPIEITFIEGKSADSPGMTLGTFLYDKKTIWDVYQEQTFRFPRRLKGVTSLTIQVPRRIHVKGFLFEKQEKAWSHLSAVEADHIYGDTFTAQADAITGIGNNVALEYTDMDFGQAATAVLQITGRCPIDKNTIHIRMSNESGEVRNIAEFTHCEDYETQSFPVSLLPGTQKVTLLFLPGSCFDLKGISFLRRI